MPAIKNAILYSLFLVSSVHISLHCQDNNEQENEEVILIFDSSSDDSNSDEMYPLQDADIACLMPEIQNHVDIIEFDQPIATAIEIPFECAQDVKNESEDEESHLIDQVFDIVEEIHPDLEIKSDLLSSSDEISDSDQVVIITKDQLEALLDGQCEQLQECLSSEKQTECDMTTIPVDCLELLIGVDNGIVLAEPQSILAQDIVVEEQDEDEIIPVPHDLINSVKKANKEKKKLEKQQRKEKNNMYKKSKKKNK
jgi:hypothetical protein